MGLSLRLSVCSGCVNLCDSTGVCVPVSAAVCDDSQHDSARVCTCVTLSRQLWRRMYRLDMYMPWGAGSVYRLCVQRGTYVNTLTSLHDAL